MTASAPGIWNIDPGHSSLFFGIRHLVIARVRGRFSRFSGVLGLDEVDLTRSTVKLEIDVASIDTALEPRDEHLRSPDFLDVARFPTATFASTSIQKKAEGGEGYELTGDFTLRGVTHPITLSATFGGRAKDARGRERVAFSAATSLDRGAFGLTWNQALEAGGLALGSRVDLEIEFEAIKA